jgi:hypothetical protein
VEENLHLLQVFGRAISLEDNPSFQIVYYRIFANGKGVFVNE